LAVKDAIIMEDFVPEEGDHVFKKVTPKDLKMEAELVSTDDLRYLPPQLKLFAQRHDPTANIKALDLEIADKFKSNFTALMYHLDLEGPSHLYGANQSIVLKAISLSIIRPVFKKYHAIELEDELFIFYEPSDAVLAALDAKDAILHYNSALTKEHEKDTLNIHGWGIHVGTMIFVEGTDIHWGDPVNTASKLGQDLAQNNDLLLSSALYELAKDNHKINDDNRIQFEARELERSHVKFTAYCVTRTEKEVD
jgi:hypothetical protein